MGQHFFYSLIADESGQDLIEYALVAALLSLCAFASMNGLGSKISNAFNIVTNNLNANI
jgi:pilus assembly protein Flp/PilA